MQHRLLLLSLLIASISSYTPASPGAPIAAAPPPPDAPHWYYKSWQECTNSDGAQTPKCPPNSSLVCGTTGDIGSLYCPNTQQQQCKDIGAAVTPTQPYGIGFICPSLMIGSSELITAAKSDNYNGAYAVVTLDAVKCGQCVEVVNTDTTNFPYAPKILAQIFNSVAAAIDVYMAGGGLGAWNGCKSNPAVGNQPLAAMYTKYITSDNTALVNYFVGIGYPNAASQINSVAAYAGGLRGGRHYAECVAGGKSSQQCQPPGNGCDGGGGMCILNNSACSLAYVGQSSYITQKAVESCQYTFDNDLHWNRPVSYTVVPCPASLTKLTGLIPVKPEEGSRVAVNSSTTTMEDCCQPSCSRAPFITGQGIPTSNWMPGMDAMYTCNLNGDKILNSQTPTEPSSCIPN